MTNQGVGWGAVFLKYHPDVSPEEANRAYYELRDAGVDISDVNKVYAAMHDYFGGDVEEERKVFSDPMTGGYIEGTKVQLSAKQRQISKDIGFPERDYAHGFFENAKNRGKI
jgi:hypothetical protein